MPFISLHRATPNTCFWITAWCRLLYVQGVGHAEVFHSSFKFVSGSARHPSYYDSPQFIMNPGLWAPPPFPVASSPPARFNCAEVLVGMYCRCFMHAGDWQWVESKTMEPEAVSKATFEGGGGGWMGPSPKVGKNKNSGKSMEIKMAHPLPTCSSWGCSMLPTCILPT